VLLPDELVEPAWPHPDRQRRTRVVVASRRRSWRSDDLEQRVGVHGVSLTV
jgi:hypothetical protein